MQRLREAFTTRNFRLLGTAGLIALTVLFLFSLANATPITVQSQTQNRGAPAPTYEYEAVTIKPSKGPGPDAKIGVWAESDGFNAWFVTLQQITSYAYGVQRFRVSGGPNWFPSERFDIEAKMEASVADALQKLSPDRRALALQKMLQSLLADRTKLTVHSETRDLPIYFLVIAKGGPKLQESKPGDTYPNAPTFPDGTRAGAGASYETRDGAAVSQAISMTHLAGMLTSELGRPVFDKTGLTGTYDFTMRYTPDDRLQPPPGLAPNERPPLPPPDSNAPSLFDALQQQLGLKLESGKGPVEIIVIDHVERPTGN
jgi:uncharacterized protein (TIGR03435 family)